MVPAFRGALDSQYLQTSCRYHMYQSGSFIKWIPTKEDRDNREVVTTGIEAGTQGSLSRRDAVLFANGDLSFVQNCRNYRLWLGEDIQRYFNFLRQQKPTQMPSLQNHLV